MIGHVLHFDYASMLGMSLTLLLQFYEKAGEIVRAKTEPSDI